MNQNQDFRFLHYPLPPDVVRLRESGDLKGAIRLIDKALIGDTHPELAARLRVERERLFRLPAEYPYPIDQDAPGVAGHDGQPVPGSHGQRPGGLAFH